MPTSWSPDELLRELVQEHRDTSFEYCKVRKPQVWVRGGSWVGGELPIEDAKTKHRFKTLALWCQQVHVEETGRQRTVSSKGVVFFQGMSLKSHEAHLNEAWESEDSDYSAWTDKLGSTDSVKQLEKVRGNNTTNGDPPTVDSSPAQAPISVDRRKLADRLQSRQVTAVQQQQHSSLALNLPVPHPVQPAYSAACLQSISPAQGIFWGAFPPASVPIPATSGFADTHSIHASLGLNAHLSLNLQNANVDAATKDTRTVNNQHITRGDEPPMLPSAPLLYPPGPLISPPLDLSCDRPTSPYICPQGQVCKSDELSNPSLGIEMKVDLPAEAITGQQLHSVATGGGGGGGGEHVDIHSSTKRGWRQCARCNESHHWNKKCRLASGVMLKACGLPHHLCLFCSRTFKSQHAVDVHLSRNEECRRRKAIRNATSDQSEALASTGTSQTQRVNANGKRPLAQYNSAPACRKSSKRCRTSHK